ncbi:MAG: hypothetical protein QOI06_1034 [Nocardioidaceae bacterium]|jgi:hypothetical protein|nr:hypothetical protein [Nocardioidaceae bacterium]
MSTESHGDPSDAKRVFLHIGAPKTGTTYLQHVLFSNSEALAKAGVLYPYDDLSESFRSAHDFCASGWFGHGPDRFRGAWDRVARRTRHWEGSTVIVSSELLSAASPDRIDRGLSMLGPGQLHVVFSARDLARQLVSDWQEHIKHKHTVTLEKFVDDLVELGPDAPKPFGKLFWGMHDAAHVLQTWAKFVPVEQIHVLTIPPRGGQPDALWTRFCAITGLDPLGYDTRAKRTNRSMGVAETELVRRMNAGARSLDQRSYDALVRLFLAERVLGGGPVGGDGPRGRRAESGSVRLTLPPYHLDWAKERSRTLIGELTAAGYPVEGDLTDLMPVAPGGEYVSPTQLTDADLGPIAIRTATALLKQAGKLREHKLELQAALETAEGTRTGRIPSFRRLAGTLRGLADRASGRLSRRR